MSTKVVPRLITEGQVQQHVDDCEKCKSFCLHFEAQELKAIKAFVEYFIEKGEKDGPGQSTAISIRAEMAMHYCGQCPPDQRDVINIIAACILRGKAKL